MDKTIMNIALPSDFGISTTYIVMQLVSFAFILMIPILNIRATQKVIRIFSGSTMPLWILVIWLLPIVGFLTAFAAVKKEEK